MNTKESFSDSIYEEQAHLAERELSFITAVTKLYDPEQAKLSAEDWLDESEIMDSPPRSQVRNWRAGHSPSETLSILHVKEAKL